MKKKRDINELAGQSFQTAIECVLKHFPLVGRKRATWVLVVYRDEPEPKEVNVITPGTSAQVAAALLVARKQLLD